MTLSTTTIVIGAGQAGLAVSSFLSVEEHDHVVLERGRIGQSWRDRWESLTLLTPNWLNRLPGGAAHDEADEFLHRAGFLAYLERYARSIEAPVVEGTAVVSVEPARRGFRIRTGRGDWLARNVVVASGACAVPHVPLAPPRGVASLHASTYRSADQLPAGTVLVVGAGASGQQLAAELRRTGREVVLAVGRHSRAPRSYRGRDIFEWLHLLGDMDRTVDEVPDLEAARRVPSFPLSGANGGEQLDLNALRDLGVAVTGRLLGFRSGRAIFGPNLAADVAKADDRLAKLLARMDAHSAAGSGDRDAIAPVELPKPMPSLTLRGVGAIVWATGYRRSYPWLRVPGVLDDSGEIPQRQGVTREPGLYVLGLPFQHRRKSHFIGGVGQDAEHVAREIVGRSQPTAVRLRAATAGAAPC
jgi:putative flavoprotein involved in K+ transport